MKSIQVANAFILRHGSDIDITNLVLNKLVYFAQVESLRETGKPLFEDKIEAWSYGPVEKDVYYTFQKYGRNRISKSEGEAANDEQTLSVVDRTLGRMSTGKEKTSRSPTMPFSHPTTV